MRRLVLCAALSLLGTAGSSCILAENFDVFSAGDAAAPADAACDGPEAGGPACSCKPGMTSTFDCDPCSHRECDGCHFGACVLNASAQCEFRGGTNSSSCGGTTSCRRCLWPKTTRRFCTAQCTWGECQCCGEVFCDSCE